MLWTACHYAAEVGILEMMKVLVAHGANIHCKSLEVMCIPKQPFASHLLHAREQVAVCT